MPLEDGPPLRTQCLLSLLSLARNSKFVETAKFVPLASQLLNKNKERTLTEYSTKARTLIQKWWLDMSAQHGAFRGTFKGNSARLFPWHRNAIVVNYRLNSRLPAAVLNNGTASRPPPSLTLPCIWDLQVFVWCLLINENLWCCGTDWAASLFSISPNLTKISINKLLCVWILQLQVQTETSASALNLSINEHRVSASEAELFFL